MSAQIPETQDYQRLVAALGNISKHLDSLGQRNSSPLGIWLLAAYQASADDTLSEDMRDLLGMEIIPALTLARELILHSPEAVTMSLAGWSKADNIISTMFERTKGFAKNQEQLPTAETVGNWIKEATLGLITEVPVSLAGVEDVFASAVATDVKWKTSFEPTRKGYPFEGWNVNRGLSDSEAHLEFFRWNENDYAVFTKTDEPTHAWMSTPSQLSTKRDPDRNQSAMLRGLGQLEALKTLMRLFSLMRSQPVPF